MGSCARAGIIVPILILPSGMQQSMAGTMCTRSWNTSIAASAAAPGGTAGIILPPGVAGTSWSQSFLCQQIRQIMMMECQEDLAFEKVGHGHFSLREGWAVAACGAIVKSDVQQSMWSASVFFWTTACGCYILLYGMRVGSGNV
eukprot:12398882-Karenia_brevis.AAC.1